MQMLVNPTNLLMSSAACCCFQMCCKQLYTTAQQLMGRIPFLKALYTTIFLLFGALAYGCMALLQKWAWFMQYLAPGLMCKSSLNSQFNCMATSIIYRIMFSLAIYHVLLAIILAIASGRVAIILNQSLFITKSIILIILFMLLLQISDQTIMVFAYGAQWLSYLFIIWQSIILIDLAYLWSIRWAANYSQGSKIYGFWLILFTIAFYSISIGLNIYGYILSSNSGGACGNYSNIIMTVLMIFMVGLQLLNFNKQNSLMTTSWITALCSYWMLSALFSNAQCSYSLTSSTSFLQANIVISFIIALISTGGSIYGSSNKHPDDHLIQNDEGIRQQQQAQKITPQQQSAQKSMWIKWHFYMAFLAAFLSMVVTQWESGNIINGQFDLTVNAERSKVIAAVATSMMYAWTLIAPRLFPERNFQFS